VVLAIGDPSASARRDHGIVSAVARTQVGISDYQFFIQTGRRIIQAFGGALVDMNGRLVGINSAIYCARAARRASALPFRQHGAGRRHLGGGGSGLVKRPWLRCRKLQEVTPEIAESLGSSARAGRWSPTSPPTAPPPGRHQDRRSDRHRRRGGDRRFPMPSTTASPPRRSAAPRRSACCAKAKTWLCRGVAEPADTPRNEVQIKGQSPFLGATVANLSPALADELRLDPQTEGVVITPSPTARRRNRSIPERRHRRLGEQPEDHQSADLERVTKPAAGSGT